MDVQPGFDLRPSVVFYRIGKISHVLLHAQLEVQSILKNEGVKHSQNKLGIVRPANYDFRILPIEPGAQLLVVGRERVRRRRCHPHQVL